MTEEAVTLSDEDEVDLIRLQSEPDGIEPPKFHPILEVWREVLKPARDEMGTKVTPNWANRVVSSYTEITYNDMTEFRNRYFSKLLQLLVILENEISTDDDCLKVANAEDDAAENSHHYKNLLMLWQMAVLEWELEWECDDEWAAVELGAISEVHKVFFGETGLTNFLDQISFEYTESDQQTLVEALEGLREANRE